MSFSDLSSDVIGHILPYLRPTPSRYRDPFLKLRLLNKATDSAIKKYRPYWVDILAKDGPRRIGPTSVHSGPIWSKCKINKAGQCRVAAHYARRQLETVYNKTDQFGAYDAVMKWLLPKMKRRIASAIKRKNKAIVKLENQLWAAAQDKVEADQKLLYITKRIKKKK